MLAFYDSDKPGMMLVNHGGMCCGIKTIYGMGEEPDSCYQEEINGDGEVDVSDVYGDDTGTHQSFFTDKAPYEKSVARLDRYIEWVKHHRPAHILEIVLATHPEREYWSQHNWFPVLLERGFKEVNSNKNSTSGNTIHIFHLNINEGVYANA